jgi:hypothetical protein
MTKTIKANRCPLCGREKKPTIKTSRSKSRVGTGVAASRKTFAAIADSVRAASSDDQTANDFAAAALKGRSP